MFLKLSNFQNSVAFPVNYSFVCVFGSGWGRIVSCYKNNNNINSKNNCCKCLHLWQNFQTFEGFEKTSKVWISLNSILIQPFSYYFNDIYYFLPITPYQVWAKLSQSQLMQKQTIFPCNHFKVLHPIQIWQISVHVAHFNLKVMLYSTFPFHS